MDAAAQPLVAQDAEAPRLLTVVNDDGYDDLVLTRAIPFRTRCAEHGTAFRGTAHIGYVPGKHLVRASSLARVVEHLAARQHGPDRLAQRVSDWLLDELAPRGVGVVVERRPCCVPDSGAVDACTISTALDGVVRDDEPTRSEFFALVAEH
jgi:GTP cyclohydrolase I